MLVNLHVKNLALIKETDIFFKEGLNILSGETGAGKSIVIGSINIALGERISKDVIREGAEYALVELIFNPEEASIFEELRKMDIDSEDGQVIISRKIMDGHSVSKINNTTVTLTALRNITSRLVDIHGQHEHQSLLDVSKHMEFLDKFAWKELEIHKENLKELYKEYKALKSRMSEFSLDEEQRNREISLLEFEINEIKSANLRQGEDEELEKQYKKMSKSGETLEILSALYNEMDKYGFGGYLSSMKSVLEYDPELEKIYSQLIDLENMTSDIQRDIYQYKSNISFDREILSEDEERLNLINKLKLKFGNSINQIMEYMQNDIDRLDAYNNYSQTKQHLENSIKSVYGRMSEEAEEISKIRKNAAGELEKKITAGLIDLNFLSAEFEIKFDKADTITEKGFDSIEFMLSTNPGEPVRSLSKIASGGELSRIMLAFKAIFAANDSIETLIFDEIDSGISGITAGKVAKRLCDISRNHQVLCITHLAQIASMADSHFLIEKSVIDNSTVTQINYLNNDEKIKEIARLLSGDEITDAVINNARESISNSNKYKNRIKLQNM